MNKGVFGFPRNGALEAKSLTAQTVNTETVSAQTISAQTVGVGQTVTAPTLTATSLLRTTGSSSSSTGIRLINDSDLGTLFRPASYTAVQSVSVNHTGNGPGSLTASISGSHLTLDHLHNCNCACSTDN